MDYGKDDLNPADSHWNTVIRGHRDTTAVAKKGWDRLVRTYNGTYYDQDANEFRIEGLDWMDDGSDDETAYHEANLLFGFTDTLTANICPPRPSATIREPSKALRDATKQREAVGNRYAKVLGLARQLKKVASYSCIYPRAFLKVSWDSKRKRPKIRTLPPYRVYFDMMADDWDDIGYIIEVEAVQRRTFLDRTQFEGERERNEKEKRYYRPDANIDARFGTYPSWLEDGRQTHGEEVVGNKASASWTVVYKVHDFTRQEVRHYLEGHHRCLLEKPLPLPHRSLPNPYRMLTMHDNLTDLGGRSDGELIFPTLKRINHMATLRLQHAQTHTPTGIINESLLDGDPEDFQEALDNSTGPGDYILLKGLQNAPIKDIIGSTPTPSLTYDHEKALGALESEAAFVMGMPAHSRGQVDNTDVATEIAALANSTEVRNADRKERVNELSAWSITACLALLHDRGDETFQMSEKVMGKDTLITMESLLFMTEDLTRIPFYFEDLEATSAAYNADSANKNASFKMLQVILTSIQENPNVDQRKLAEKILELAGFEDLMMSEEEAKESAAAMAPPAQGVTPPNPEDLPTGDPGMEAAMSGQLGVSGEAPQGGAVGTPENV
jgi:hypothetical protein